MSHDLQILADHRDALLLAEVAAWLHDYRKCSEEQLQAQSANRTGQGIPRTELTDRFGMLNNVTITLGSATEQLPDLLNRWQGSWNNTNVSILLQYLSRCHNTAHFDKQDPGNNGKQSYPGTQMGSAFGFERPVGASLTRRLWAVPWNSISVYNLVGRDSLQTNISELFSQAVADTRRPINEIALWDWSCLVAALYKASIAGMVLGNQPPPADLRWRLLSVRIDSATFLDHVSRLPDLLVRQQLLQNGLDQARNLLEVTYPLGSEVYRDENGSLYVVPDIADLLQATDANGSSLSMLVQQAFSVGTVDGDQSLSLSGEVIPQVVLDFEPWWGQRPDRNDPVSNDEIPPVGRVLGQEIDSPADADAVTKWWTDKRGDICPVCGLRPQAASQSKAGRRNVCQVCERRRQDRAKAWVANLGSATIWLDEVADSYGRAVLLVGQFDLEPWLTGDMVQTITVADPQSPSGQSSGDIGKTPSFSRLRRVWETTHHFWQEVLPTNPDEDLAQSLVVQVVGRTGSRLVLKGSMRPFGEQATLGPYHAYDLAVGDGIKLSVLWDPILQQFITADNLSYVIRLFGQEIPSQNESESEFNYVQRVQMWIVETLRTILVGRFSIGEPTGYGSENAIWGEIVIESDGIGQVADEVGSVIQFPPVIPILAEPRTFMALVPANRALDIVAKIKKKYETEMGKVRNRLPLSLGIVYAGRRTPLSSVLDAGRRMLQRPACTEHAAVIGVSPVTPWPDEVTLTLTLNEREVTVAVPTVMGDGTTPDVWYPYWQVQGKPTDRTRWFVGPDNEHWVHVTDLRVGDSVAFMPSTFDFEYLDVSARRFEVAYGDDGQRLSDDRRQRPYLLEELADLDATWAQISLLPLSQIKAIDALFEAKRAAWKDAPQGKETLTQLIDDTLHLADVHSPALAKAAASGMLADALEIHLTIHKEVPQQEEA